MLKMPKHCLAHLILALFLMTLPVQAVNPVVSQKIDTAIEAHIEEIINTRRFFHMNPELGNREFKTGNLLASKLLSLGLEVKKGIAKTGLTALLRGEDPGITIDGDYSFQYSKGSPPLYNHPSLAKIMTPSLLQVLGDDHVNPIQPQMVAEDFSFYSRKIPGFYFFLGVKNPTLLTMPALHNPLFTPDEESIPIGIKIMCHLLLDCLDHQHQITGNWP